MMPKPPVSVPGPHRPAAPPPGIPTQHLPAVRYYYPRGNETLADVSQIYFNNPREAVRIYNANRVGFLRSDRSPGFLLTLNDILPAGAPLVIP